MKTIKNAVYEAPRAEIIELEFQGFLCASGGQGGTENLEVEDITINPFKP